MLQDISVRLAALLKVRVKQVVDTISLLDEGATVPFIARYRKEVTGGLDDIQLRELSEKLSYLRELDDRRETILNSIREQGKLTDELEKAIYACDNKTVLEDLYLPYKPKRRTKAMIAREAGLEPFAMEVLANQECDYILLAESYLNVEKNINSVADVISGAKFILIEHFAEKAEVIGTIRDRMTRQCSISSTVIKGSEDQAAKYRDYFEFSQSVVNIPSHRALAILRGANEGFLRVSIVDPELETTVVSVNSYEAIIVDNFAISLTSKCSQLLLECVSLCFKAKIFTSLENELINMVKERSDVEAINVFASNLHSLLLQSPAGARNTIGLDPGIRTGVKVAVIDSTGKLLDYTTIYPFQPRNDVSGSIAKLVQLIQQYSIELVSIGNGTASRETDMLVGQLMREYPNLAITKVTVSESGASVYSASEYASREFPDLDVSIRGAVSIARRLQDPLAELVKIDPKAIGVGQYQHDVNQAKLAQSLENTVEDCVNKVGVDVNTASVPLLTHVAGLNSVIAKNIVAYRDTNGRFANRQQLKKVPRLGDKTFEQCAGFLRIANGDNPLDSSAVHPESYPLVNMIIAKAGVALDKIIGNTSVLSSLKPTELVSDGYGLPTVIDVLAELDKPGRDPRGEFVYAVFDDKVNTVQDLEIGMELEGVITNVTNFGAFVDIGVHQDGLVHISELSDSYVTNPADVVKTGQLVKVKVIELDLARNRVALSMKTSGKSDSNTTKPRSNNQARSNSNQATSANSMMEAFAKLRR